MAVPMGMPIATTVPNVKVRISIAARMPMTSLVDVSLGERTLPIAAPPTTSMPAFRPGSAASSTRCASASFRSLELMSSSTEMNAVFPSLESCALPPWSNGLSALSTNGIFLIAAYESVIAVLLAASVTLPLEAWKMIGFEPF
jgi:hypothetical protein